MDWMRSGVVLAGGGSTRFDDGDKALAELRGKPLIGHVVDSVSEAVSEVVVAARDVEQAEQLSFLDAEVTTDTVEGYGPVAGIHAGFSAASGDSCFVSACDTPLLAPGIVDLLFEESAGFAGAVPSDGDHLEPLTAVYGREVTVEAAELAIERGDHRIIEMYRDLGPINMVPFESLREVDPGLDSFLNVNTVEDLEEAGARVGRVGGEA